MTTGLPKPGTPPGLLVSVRSATEATEAVLGGASVIDVKEPDRGPLGCADPIVWRAVRDAVPPSLPVSVALGELREWADRETPPPEAFVGITFRKVGLSGMAGTDWRSAWDRLRRRFGPGPGWVAVVYLDADRAESPPPDEIRSAVLELPECVGLLLDSWDKTRPADLGTLSPTWFDPLRLAGLRVAIAGGLDSRSIRRFLPLQPDWFAVRGSACSGGDRGATIAQLRVRTLADALPRPVDPFVRPR